MQTVFRLLEDDRARRIDHLIGRFFTVMCRQAVHEDGIALSTSEEIRIHLIIAETMSRLAASASCPMLAHTSV